VREELSEHAARNRAAWDVWAAEYVAAGERAWASADPSWGIWSIPEADVRALPDVAGMDTLELGCGTAYWSAWLARRGARPVGLDNSERQLETARRLQREHGLEFPLLHGSAEAVPYPDESFDLVLSEYGASLWCDPARWIAEAARVLRPGGWLVFLTNSPLIVMCWPEVGAAGERLLRPQFGMRAYEWPENDGAVEFHLPHGELVRLLRRLSLEVLDLVELQAPENGDAGQWSENVTLEWARQWPSEEIWVARKAPTSP
jgi:SAM-dependent methyltransferase